ncbi:MAG: hypothetical protein EBX40_02700 [Gammaproteobacteria bacterium]|nr:hypothetical protein [Gammaproteobacteria bacterium]
MCTFDKNVCSIEDPVEIQLSGVNQIAVNRKIGLDFAQILKALLRQDPDILMIGEIRDAETACLAIKAAETGHLVLATLHTQTALEALLRLKHLGVEPLHLSSCLSLLVAQRLLRKTSESGYCGRIAAFEVIRWNDQFTESFLRGDSIKHLQTEAKALGFKTLLEHATALSTAGLTSREEILRVC